MLSQKSLMMRKRINDREVFGIYELMFYYTTGKEVKL